MWLMQLGAMGVALLVSGHTTPTRRPKDLLDTIRSISCESASFVVTIEGRPYAGFVNRAYAEMAVGLWSGEIDGNGLPVPPHERAGRGWPAARGRRLEILELGGRRR
jgi:hypothetical protein